MAKPRILIVSDDPHQNVLMQQWLERAGCDTALTSLSRIPDSKHPYVEDVLAQPENAILHGIYIHDPSKPQDYSPNQTLHEQWSKARKELKSIQNMSDHAKERVDVIVSGVLEALGRTDIDKDAYLEKARQELVDTLGEKMKVLEGLMLTNPPSQAGIALVRKLRDKDSPYKNTFLFADNIYFDREKELREAGANAVNPTSSQHQGYRLMVEELRSRKILSSAPGKEALSKGPTSAVNKADNPPDRQGPSPS